jgi:DNA polymerase (family 10)
MLKIQGLGPKSIALIIEHFRVTTVDGLEQLAREQKLRGLPRMGAKLEEKVLRSIAQYRKSTGRFLLNFAAEIADLLGADLKQVSGVAQVTPAGSLRRGKETVGDLDLLVTGPNPTAALDAFVKHPRVGQVLARGENKASAEVGVEALQVDLRTLPEESFGAALQYFTGSKEHGVAVRTRAVRMGLTLNEYGLFEVEGMRPFPASTEEAIYAKLGLPWIPPSCARIAAKSKRPSEERFPA